MVTVCNGMESKRLKYVNAKLKCPLFSKVKMSPFGLPESCAPNTRPNTRVTQTGLGRKERSDRSPRPVTSPSSGGYPARARLQWLPPGVVRRWLVGQPR